MKKEKCGLKISDACWPHQITEQTYYRWKRKYGGMEVSEARRLKELEEENQRLKRLVADQALGIQILKEVNSKNGEPHAEEAGSGNGGEHGAEWSETSVPPCREVSREISAGLKTNWAPKPSRPTPTEPLRREIYCIRISAPGLQRVKR